MTVTIRGEDLVTSVRDALQFISYFHPADYIRHLRAAWEREESPAAKDAMTQILVNSRMSALGRRPICQDTGIVNCFVKVGQEVRWDTKASIRDLINEGVRDRIAHRGGTGDFKERGADTRLSCAANDFGDHVRRIFGFRRNADFPCRRNRSSRLKFRDGRGVDIAESNGALPAQTSDKRIK